jgi:hypothetical protein
VERNRGVEKIEGKEREREREREREEQKHTNCIVYFSTHLWLHAVP